MWIVAGLGNPGRKYHRTRHNLGFEVVEQLAERLGLRFKRTELYEIAKGVYGDEEILLLKPLTFMNLSGNALKDLYEQNPFDTSHLILIHDDLDLPPGRIKLKKGGSSGGHRGVQSIIESLSTTDFIRVKLGIGKPVDEPVEGYVLRRFSPSERALIDEAIQKAADAVLDIITSGIERAMNIYNKKDS
ncbi:MAG: aminoacyl-tRNA hydrolase [Nitrospirae bacterium]|nr:MAG: aminoacyl-tRNA hydrolase [Nitrospirota bacterium]